MPASVEIVTIGDELLLGATVDTNAVFIATALSEVGVQVVRRATVGDTEEAIADAVQQALERTGAVITTGGLGPTADDLTRPVLAKLFGRELHEDASIVAALQELWRTRGRGGVLPPSNLQQALVPDGAEILVNRQGTAPGLKLTDAQGRWVAMFPGVPRELRAMVVEHLVPWLGAQAGDRVLRSRYVRTTGIAESALADKLGAMKRRVESLPLAYLPGWDGVDLRVTAADMSASEASAKLDAAVEQLRQAAGTHAYAVDRVSMPETVLAMARAHGDTIAVAESCTGGLLGTRLTDVPGSSDVVHGGVIAYANHVKEQELGVSSDDIATHGAVSEPVAVQMARGVRGLTGATIGVGITGVAGPDGGTPEKPVGTVWIAVDVRGEVRAIRSVFIGDRPEIRHRATQSALDMIRRALLVLAS
jgi:nicotinamide-nucleotide amidase